MYDRKEQLMSKNQDYARLCGKEKGMLRFAKINKYMKLLKKQNERHKMTKLRKEI